MGYDAPHNGTGLIQGLIKVCSADPRRFGAIGEVAKATDHSRNVISTGLYRREEVVSLIGRYDLDVMIIASPWPETYCFTLSEAWAAGVPAVVGPLGAPAERVAASGAGLVTPDYRVATFAAA